MPASEFIERVAKHIDRLDHQNLKNYVLELVRQNQFFMQLLDYTSEAIMVLNLRKEIVYLNRRMIQSFNLSPEIIRKGTLSQAVKDQHLVTLISTSINQKKEIFQKELEVMLPRPMLLNLNLFYSKDDNPFVIVGLTNVTQAENEIRERFKLENWETMIGLAAAIAHELGNPLNSLSIHVNLLEKSIEKLPQAQTKKISDSLNVLKDETARLDKIIRNFLKATRRKPLRFQIGQINDLLGKTIDFLKPEIKAAKIRITEDYDSEMPEFLFDSERIHQVIVNIVKNAIDAMPKGGTLKLETKAQDKLCMIRFIDSGIGIASEKMDKIFDAYYTTKEEGTGLGLMIVYQIIKEHGGRIDVKSKPKAGTEFTIILPIRKEKLGLPSPTGAKQKL